ncbi:MAG: ABC transporter substrate-binding protein [Glycomyces artemisiae]|uniref:ABC transporter substrate-binding protein n=1 Tax=Glycomyces artemisiae TaxID=1076443 RepID=A0A850C5Q8_9ACTN|nr:ABC transporter substrate-binding protein [Glycomyces artemisiae]
MATSNEAGRRSTPRTRWSRRIPALLGVLAVATACVNVRDSSDGDGEPAGDGPLELAVVPKAVGHEFWNAVRDGAECAAELDGDVTVRWDGVSAETEVEGQINLLQNFITTRVDGIVYAATDSAALAPVTQQALDADIPVAMFDSGTDPQPDEVPLFATDNTAGATEAADLLAEALGEGDHDVALIEFQPGAQTNTERVEGFTAGLEQHPNLHLVAQQPSHSDVNEARRVTEDILTANPDLKGVFAANEPSVLGAVQAIEAAGRTGEIAVIGWDAAPDEVGALRAGQIDALVVQNPFAMGYYGVASMVEHLREGAPMASADTGVTFVTAENIDTEEVQAVLEPSCDNPPEDL